jgi:DNA invertase Pin-like site-specific DNA recombinase
MPHLDLTTSIGRSFIAFLSALAQDERQRIANAGRAVAKARGVEFGRKPKLTGRQQTEGRRLEAGESARTIARDSMSTMPRCSRAGRVDFLGATEDGKGEGVRCKSVNRRRR